jgi:hypothetical protein
LKNLRGMLTGRCVRLLKRVDYRCCAESWQTFHGFISI